ncbi:MAG: glycerol-3-phosphate 1-O-acyltransferase PlsY [Phycisphaerae bacterium]|nr:glycerol-3-phosphate 1-O-acyltransferase PlsY [Phycisphaerae bacterium]
MFTSVPSIVLLAVVGAYLLGSIPFGLLVAKVCGVDIRTVGSRNIGATNVSRTLGRPWGMLVFFLDVLKGLLPTLIAGLALAEAGGESGISQAWRNICVLAVGITAVLGHNYPVFLGFRGGKGVATTLGIALGVYPELTCAALAAFGVWVVVTLISRYVSVGSMCAAVAFPLVLVLVFGRQEGFLANSWPLVVCSSLLAVMIIYRHRKNILRLREGTEQKIGKPGK